MLSWPSCCLTVHFGLREGQQPSQLTSYRVRQARNGNDASLECVNERFSPILLANDRDREIIVLRGIEQHAYREIAVLLNEDAKALAVRYQRALEKLRQLLPSAIFDEFDDN